MLSQLQRSLASRFAAPKPGAQIERNKAEAVKASSISTLEKFQQGLARTLALRVASLQSQGSSDVATVTESKSESLMPVYACMGAMLCVAAYLSDGPYRIQAERAAVADKVSMADVSILSARSNRSISSETVTNLDNLGWQAYGAHMRVHQLIEQGASPDQLRLALESRRTSYQQLDAEVERTRVMHGKSNGWVSPWGSLRDALHEAGEAFTEVAARVGEPHLGFMDGLPYSHEDRLLTEGLPHDAAEDKAKFFATMMNARLNGTTYTHTLGELKEAARQRLYEESQEHFAARPGQS